MKLTPSIRWISLLAIIALILAACGSDAAEDETTTTAAPATTAAPGDTTADTSPDETTPPDTGQTLAGLTVIDDLTFEVQLRTPDPEFPAQMAYAAYYPLPSVAFDDPLAFEESPIGNGPFRMDGVWENDVRIPMVAYEDYAGENTPQIDSLEFLIISDLNTAYNEVRAGSLDILGPTIPPDQLATAPDEFGDRFGQSPTNSFTYIGFPSYLEELTLDHKRALSMAIDRVTINDVIFAGARAPAFSAIPPALAGHRANVCDYWDHNPDDAATLWEQAGPLDEITVWFNTGGGHEDWVEAVSNMWRDTLGIETINFESLEFSEYLPLLDNQEITGPFRLGWGQDYPSPLNFLEPLYASYNAPPVGSNNTIYDNPDFDALLAQGKEAVAASGELADGVPFYQQAEDLLCDDAQIAPIYFNTNNFVYTEGIGNVLFDSYSDLGYTDVTSDDGAVSYHITEPEHLFPTTSNEQNGIAVLRALFSGLVQFDWATNEPYNLVADEITSDDGGQTWTITLEPGWTFHNGESVTAESFVNAWNYGALGANGQQNNSFYSNIVGYDELNPSDG